MKTDREVLQQALDALEAASLIMDTDAMQKQEEAVKAIRAKLSEPDHQALELARLGALFTKLDQPRYKGDPMLDSVLETRNDEFRAWAESLPKEYWARYDLSAARIGWEAAKKRSWRPISEAPLDRAVRLFGKRAGEIHGIYEGEGEDAGYYKPGGDYPGFDWVSIHGQVYTTWLRPTHFAELEEPNG